MEDMSIRLENENITQKLSVGISNPAFLFSAEGQERLHALMGENGAENRLDDERLACKDPTR